MKVEDDVDDAAQGCCAAAMLTVGLLLLAGIIATFFARCA